MLTAPLLAAFLLFGLLRQTFPPDNEILRVPGLSAPAAITFDGDGVPRIRAANERDAIVALGFVHARDRMFQMELMRRAAAGRLSEWAGPATLPLDRQMRTFGLARLAEGDVAAQTPEARDLLEAYAAGVNAWIADRGRFAAPEFLPLGPPEPWRPADSLMWARTMGLWLSGNYRTELVRQQLRDKVAPEVLERLWPAWTPFVGSDARRADGPDDPRYAAAANAAAAAAKAGTDVHSGAGTDIAALRAALPAFPAPFTLPSTASNAWAVDGRHSETGFPLLAGDPHLSFGFPGLWYLVRIDTPGHVLAGATGPGAPFLVIGRNERIAWTFTTTGADTQDVFLEPPDARFTSREERIGVRGQGDVLLTVRESRHGPVLSDLAPPPDPPRPDARAVAVAMANLQPDDTAASGLLALNRARSVEEAGRAAPLIASPAQNLMVADRDGIGLFVTGKIPLRRNGDGRAPVPGNAAAPVTGDGAGLVEDADAFGWTGFASGEALPHYVAPAGGRLVNANEPVWPPNFPVMMGRDTFRDGRARRIRALLDATPKHSVTEFAAMQMDVVSNVAAALLPRLREVPGVPDSLRAWDGSMTGDAPQPLIFNAWMVEFHRAVLAREGLQPWASAPAFDFVPYVLSPEGARWCGGDCGPLLKSSLDATMSSLAARFGPDPAAWRWDTPHQAVFAHPFLRALPVLGALTTARIAVPGDFTTLNRGGTNEAMESVHGASYRGVYDLADLDRSRFVVVPGQSGHPFGRHARDFLVRWRDGGSVTLGPEPAVITGGARLLP